MFFCGTFSITSNSRMMYAFARDGGIPGHKFFNKVDPKRKVPVRTGMYSSHNAATEITSQRNFAVWLACFLSFCLGLPSLGSTVAFAAATSIATIGLYISYGMSRALNNSLHSKVSSRTAIPIALRVVYAKKFVRGPFHLGRFSYPVAVVAVVWVAFIVIAFILPTENPVNSQTLNYSIVAVGIILTYSMGFWAISARKWFTGPIKYIEGLPLFLYLSSGTTLKLCHVFYHLQRRIRVWTSPIL
jgi:hypothetical protein